METYSALLVICAGNSPVTGEFPTQRPVTRSFDVLFDLRLNKRLSKHSWGWWFETPSRPLWRHCNVNWCIDWCVVTLYWLFWSLFMNLIISICVDEFVTSYIPASTTNEIYIKWNMHKARGLFCFVMVVFTHFLQGYLASSGAFKLISHCHWQKLYEKYGHINHTSL